MSTEILDKPQTPPEATFGKWRSFFWPVHTHELKKLLPMFAMFFFISFVYSILRNTKDALIVTAPGSGAEAIPFLKVGGVVPAAILFMMGYAKLSNLLSKENLFYSTILFFVSFFVLFDLFLYPNKEFLHPISFCAWLRSVLPLGFHGFVAVLQNWTYALFYIFSELWGSFALSLLFWGFANDITRFNEAKRFYALFGLGANLALITAGPTANFLMKYASPAATDIWKGPLHYIVALAVVSSAAVIWIYRWINQNVLTDPRFYDPTERVKAKKEKPKMPLMESFAYLARSKHVLCIALVVLAYNISINLIEVTWKNQLKLLFPNGPDYLHFMNKYYSPILGYTTVLMMLFVSSNVLRRFGWGFTALITPVVLLVTGAGFFIFMLFGGPLEPALVKLGVSALFVSVVFGTVQNILSKSAKYSLFDPTKEMAYIPLDQEAKVKGKAVIDTVGARLGKAGGSFIQLGLLAVLDTLSRAAPWIAGILFAIVAVWIWAVRGLTKEFAALEQKGQKVV